MISLGVSVEHECEECMLNFPCKSSLILHHRWEHSGDHKQSSCLSEDTDNKKVDEVNLNNT